MRVRNVKATLFAIIALLALVATIAAPVFADVAEPQIGPALYENSGTFGASYTLVNKYCSSYNGTNNVNKVGILRGFGNSQSYNVYVWKVNNGGTPDVITSFTNTTPGLYWNDISSSGVSMGQTQCIYVGIDQNSGYSGTDFGPVSTVGNLCNSSGLVCTQGSQYHNPQNNNLGASGWTLGAYWYDVLIQTSN